MTVAFFLMGQSFSSEQETMTESSLCQGVAAEHMVDCLKNTQALGDTDMDTATALAILTAFVR